MSTTHAVLCPLTAPNARQDAYPRALVQHLPALASARGVPLVCVRAKDGAS